MSIYELLRTRWIEAGIGVNESIAEWALQQFEKKHNISLPGTFREYLFIVNGMGEGHVDENLISFLSLEAIDQAANHKEISINQLEIVVAEYSIYSHVYVLRLSRGEDRSPVFATDGTREQHIASSFEEFVHQYMDNPAKVADCWRQDGGGDRGR